MIATAESPATRATGERQRVDPVTLEVIRHGIISIADQIDANMTRTAYSAYIYEYKDYAVGLSGPDGELLAQSTGAMPVFVADSVGMAVRDGLAIYGRDRLRHGDVVLCNHAAIQGQHLNNTVMYTPIFAGPARTELIGFFAINAHWFDIGGSAVGSLSMRSKDIFMEGLQLRTVKLWSGGEPVEEMYRIIENNTRFPLEVMGDLGAQLAGCLLGRDQTARVADKYGVSTYLSAVATILDQTEAAAREKIARIPDGTYTAESFLDDDGVGTDPVPIVVHVIVEGDELTVDYTDIADEVVGAINSGRYGGGRTVARVAFKYLIATDEPANEGMFRPVKLILPEGKLVSAKATAPMSNYSFPFPTIIDTFIKALEKALPDRVTGAHFGSFSSLRFIGKNSDGSPFQCYDSGHGGWGACATHDGAGPFRTMAHGDTRIIPVELQESMYPYLLEEFSLREDSGGAGTFRGGMGYRKRYRVLAPCTLTTNYERIKCPPWGVLGGGTAKPGRCIVIRADGTEEVASKTEGLPVYPGDVVIAETGGGGGYGAAAARALEAIQRDVTRGYVTPEAAARDYGVRVAPDGEVTR
jgi:N-methylhydantoinase B